MLDERRNPAAQLHAAEDDGRAEHRAEQDADGPADSVHQCAFPRGFRIGQGLAGEDGCAGFFVDVDDVGHLLSLSPGGMINGAGSDNLCFPLIILKEDSFMTFQTEDQKHDEEMKHFIEFLAVVLGGGIPVKPVRLCSVPTAFYSVPQCVDYATEANYHANVAALMEYAKRCGLFRNS